jgi:formylglycine-generating enzyme required for sulfatase activity
VVPFWLDGHEVTNAEFREFVEQSGYEAEGKWRAWARSGRDDHPVVGVSWNDARAYAEWAGKRLPTEAEWEYAAHGGLAARWFPWGDEPDPERANYRHRGESFGAGLARIMGMRRIGTTPVGSYDANGFGLYDMCGNVSEWCADTYAPYPGSEDDPDTYRRHEEPGRVYRGGDWESPNPVFVRLTTRNGALPGSFSRTRGFRCALSE